MFQNVCKLLQIWRHCSCIHTSILFVFVVFILWISLYYIINFLPLQNVTKSLYPKLGSLLARTFICSVSFVPAEDAEVFRQSNHLLMTQSRSVVLWVWVLFENRPALYFCNYTFISAYKIHFFYSVSKILFQFFCLCYWISLPIIIKMKILLHAVCKIFNKQGIQHTYMYYSFYFPYNYKNRVLACFQRRTPQF